MSSAYFASLVSKPVVVTEAGRYLTRCGEVVNVTKVSTEHDLGCIGSYGNGTVERWHKSGRIFAGTETANDIVGAAIGKTPVRDPRFSLQREFTGQPTAMWVIRFCGSWLGLQFKTREQARAVRRAAIVGRKATLQGSPAGA